MFMIAEFRLLGGPNDASGRIEVRFNNAWGTVCDDSFNQNAGNMICKELGYQWVIITVTS